MSTNPPDILKAARLNNFSEAERAIKQDPDYHSKLTGNQLNALQVAIIEFHEEMALFLLNRGKISTTHKDEFGRDALQLALQYGSDELAIAMYEAWGKELKMPPDPSDPMPTKNGGVINFTPKPS